MCGGICVFCLLQCMLPIHNNNRWPDIPAELGEVVRVLSNPLYSRREIRRQIRYSGLYIFNDRERIRRDNGQWPKPPLGCHASPCIRPTRITDRLAGCGRHTLDISKQLSNGYFRYPADSSVLWAYLFSQVRIIYTCIDNDIINVYAKNRCFN